MPKQYQNAFYLPPEIGLIFSLIVGQSCQVISKVLGRLIVQNIDVGSRGRNPGVVSSSHHNWDNVESQGFEELLSHIIRAEGILKGKIKPRQDAVLVVIVVNVNVTYR